ncbi:MAG TPA: deoxyribose-phosphate aldolase [Candidatus Eisenbacteria bacterium]
MTALIPLAARVDATLLTPGALPAEIEALCAEACRLETAAVCVLPFHVARAAAATLGSRVRVAAALSFPFGAAPPAAKGAEAEAAARDGAHELDVVVNLAAVKAGHWEVVAAEIDAVREAAPGRLTKWILECAALTEDEIRRAVAVVAGAGGDFVKTSTGYGPGGATVATVRLLRSLAGSMGVKASGGIATRAQAIALVDAGADRIGTSRARAVVEGGTA